MKEKLAEAFRQLSIVTGLVDDLLRSREELVAEYMMLLQQLIAVERKVAQPSLRPHERGLPVDMSSTVRRWRDAILVIQPETILRWHREGFRLLWRRKTKSGTARRSPLVKETFDLIKRMSEENRLWGAERIRSEQRKLGIHVLKRMLGSCHHSRRGPSEERARRIR